MNSREIVRRTIAFESPGRMAFDYYAYGQWYTDIITSYLDWELQYDKRVWVEQGREFYTDAYSNVWARVVGDTATKGEVYQGALQSSWDVLETFRMPPLGAAARSSRVRRLFQVHSNLFKVGCLGNASFGILSKLRGFANLMEDLLLETARVQEGCQIVEAELLEAVKSYGLSGADGIHIMEDWGSQDGPFISPALWDKLFAPGYSKLCTTAHQYGMFVILHSCGMLRDLLERFIECGVDVLQLDQTHNYWWPNGKRGIQGLASEYAGRVTFFCPVDIQRTLVTGDSYQIEDEVRQLVRSLASRQGGFIAKSYGRARKMDLNAIGCDPAWNDFAFECFRKYGQELFAVEFDVPMLRDVAIQDAREANFDYPPKS